MLPFKLDNCLGGKNNQLVKIKGATSVCLLSTIVYDKYIAHCNIYTKEGLEITIQINLQRYLSP